MKPSAYRIVILGGGTAGWMCAAALGSLIATGRFSVQLVESDDIGTVGVGEATLPHLKAFNDRIGLDEAEFMRRTGATFKLGIEFVGWGQGENGYIHPFGTFGQPWAGVDFHHHWLRARKVGYEVAPLEAYSLAIVAARAGRFDFPALDANSLKSSYAYAYHIDAGLYAACLRDVATGRGVVRREGKVTAVDIHPQNGDVTALKLLSGEAIGGDLFIDASGFAGLIIDKALKAGWDDWSDVLPCDRAWAVPTAIPEGAGLTPYTRAIARAVGWQWRIPLQHRIGNGYVFASRFVGEDEALATLHADLDGPPLVEPRLLRFSAGRRRQAWVKNCVALGLAGGFLEPLESTSLYLVQAAIAQLQMRLTGHPADDRARNAFNGAMDIEYERIRDFLILHYHANQRPEALWRHCREMTLPESLRYKIELFRHRGALPAYRDGLFSPPSWLAVFMGQDLAATGYDRMADTLPQAAVAEKLGELQRRIAAQVERMPSHADMLRDYGQALPLPSRQGAV